MPRTEYKTFQQKITFILLNGSLHFCHRSQTYKFMFSDTTTGNDINPRTCNITEAVSQIYKKLKS